MEKCDFIGTEPGEKTPKQVKLFTLLETDFLRLVLNTDKQTLSIVKIHL